MDFHGENNESRGGVIWFQLVQLVPNFNLFPTRVEGVFRGLQRLCSYVHRNWPNSLCGGGLVLGGCWVGGGWVVGVET